MRVHGGYPRVHVYEDAMVLARVANREGSLVHQDGEVALVLPVVATRAAGRRDALSIKGTRVPRHKDVGVAPRSSVYAYESTCRLP